MNTTVKMEQSKKVSPSFKARIAGLFYLGTFVTGILSLVFVNGRLVTNLIATVCYIAVTILFYDLFKPVNKKISLLAALFSLAGCAIGTLSSFDVNPFPINSLVFFGVYCILIGYLIFRSTFLPRILGVLMVIGGLGWLTFLSPALVKILSPYNMLPGILGEGMLILWLLVMGVNVERWREQASATREY
jgi:hypothetical protein